MPTGRLTGKSCLNRTINYNYPYFTPKRIFGANKRHLKKLLTGVTFEETTPDYYIVLLFAVYKARHSYSPELNRISSVTD